MKSRYVSAGHITKIYYSKHIIVCIAAEPSLRAKRSNLLRLPRLCAGKVKQPKARQDTSACRHVADAPRNDRFRSFEVNYFMLPLISA